MMEWNTDDPGCSQGTLTSTIIENQAVSICSLYENESNHSSSYSFGFEEEKNLPKINLASNEQVGNNYDSPDLCKDIKQINLMLNDANSFLANSFDEQFTNKEIKKTEIELPPSLKGKNCESNNGDFDSKSFIRKIELNSLSDVNTEPLNTCHVAEDIEVNSCLVENISEPSFDSIQEIVAGSQRNGNNELNLKEVKESLINEVNGVERDSKLESKTFYESKNKIQVKDNISLGSKIVPLFDEITENDDVFKRKTRSSDRLLRGKSECCERRNPRSQRLCRREKTEKKKIEDCCENDPNTLKEFENIEASNNSNKRKLEVGDETNLTENENVSEVKEFAKPAKVKKKCEEKFKDGWTLIALPDSDKATIQPKFNYNRKQNFSFNEKYSKSSIPDKLSAFKIFITDEIVEMIRTWTNAHALHFIESKKKERLSSTNDTKLNVQKNKDKNTNVKVEIIQSKDQKLSNNTENKVSTNDDTSTKSLPESINCDEKSFDNDLVGNLDYIKNMNIEEKEKDVNDYKSQNIEIEKRLNQCGVKVIHLKNKESRTNNTNESCTQNVLCVENLDSSSTSIINDSSSLSSDKKDYLNVKNDKCDIDDKNHLHKDISMNVNVRNTNSSIHNDCTSFDNLGRENDQTQTVLPLNNIEDNLKIDSNNLCIKSLEIKLLKKDVNKSQLNKDFDTNFSLKEESQEKEKLHSPGESDQMSKVAIFQITDTEEVLIYGRHWTEVTVEEMWTFVFLVMLTTINKMPRLIDYWALDIVASGPPVFCSSVMSRNRFLQIHKFIGFNNPNSLTANCPETGLFTFSNVLKKTCFNVLDPGLTLVVSEWMPGFKGRFSFRNFSIGENQKGVKRLGIVCPADEMLRGYTLNWVVFEDEDKCKLNLAKDDLLLNEYMVVHLLDSAGLLDQGHQIVVDSKYMTENLSIYLLKRKTYCLGTVKNQEIPRHLHVDLEENMAVFARKGVNLAVKWQSKPNESYYLMTNKISGSEFCDRKKYRQPGRNRLYRKPDMVDFYNYSMTPANQMTKIFRNCDCSHRCPQYSRNLGLHLLTRMALNSKILYNCMWNVNEKCDGATFADYLKDLTKEGLKFYNQGAKKLVRTLEKKMHESRNKNPSCLEVKPPRVYKKKYASPEVLSSLAECTPAELAAYSDSPMRTTPAKPANSFEEFLTVNLPGHHGLYNIPPRGKTRYPTKNCAYCWTSSKRKQTRMHCVGCPKQPGLCSPGCFKTFHLNRIYMNQ